MSLAANAEKLEAFSLKWFRLSQDSNVGPLHGFHRPRSAHDTGSRSDHRLLATKVADSNTKRHPTLGD
jgi:hypothetical protein